MEVASIDIGRLNQWLRGRDGVFTRHPLALAFSLSLTLHLGVFGLLEIGHRLGWWQQSLWAQWLRSDVVKLAQARRNKPNPQAQVKPAEQYVPLVFVQVDPTTATTETPKNAQYYSSQNSLAANVDTRRDTAAPKVDGTQTKISKTTSAARPATVPLQPSPPPPAPKQATPLAEAKAEIKPATPRGNTITARPAIEATEHVVAQPAAPPAPPVRPRPRRLADLAQPTGVLAGEKMKQEGGVKRAALTSSLDVKATPYGSYDEQIIVAIQNRWYQLLDQSEFVQGHTGKVVLEFAMLPNGSITDMQVKENTVGDYLGLLCESAVIDPAPYPPWPTELRRILGRNSRLVRFTFYYD